MRKSISAMCEFKFMNAIKIAMIILYNTEGSLELLDLFAYTTLKSNLYIPNTNQMSAGNPLVSISICLMKGNPNIRSIHDPIVHWLGKSLTAIPTYTVQHDPPLSTRCATFAKMSYTCFPPHADAFVPPRVDTQCRRQLSWIRRQPSWILGSRGNPLCPYAVDCAVPTAKYIVSD